MTSVAPDTVVLVHGLWMTPRSWEKWVPYYEAKGFTVLTPGYPGFDVEVEALRENPDVIAKLTVPETVDHLAAVIESVATPPIIMGHSFGGTLTQLLLARGLGAAAVAIDSAPTEGVRVSPPSQVKSLFPILKNPKTRHRAAGFTPEEFHYSFTNTLSEDESQEVYDRYHIPAPGQWVWDYGLIANFKPGHQETWVDFDADRAPLLFIAGGADHIMPASVNKSNAHHYRSPPPSPTTTSSPAARTGPAASQVGRPSPTTRSTGRLRTPLEDLHRPPHDVARADHPHRRADHTDRTRRVANPHRPHVRSARPAPRGCGPHALTHGVSRGES